MARDFDRLVKRRVNADLMPVLMTDVPIRNRKTNAVDKAAFDICLPHETFAYLATYKDRSHFVDRVLCGGLQSCQRCWQTYVDEEWFALHPARHEI